MNGSQASGSREDMKILLGMLETLLDDLKSIPQQGAGYYSPDSFIDRYNRLLPVAEDLFGGSRLMRTFSPIETRKSVDPSDKMKMNQKVIIETGQLISLVKSYLDRAPEPGE